MNNYLIKKDLKGRDNESSVIEGQYLVEYSTTDKSRYKHIDVLKLTTGEYVHSTLSLIDLSILPKSRLIDYTVTASDENRLDIIAYKLYGKSSLWWVIAYMNKLECKDPLNIPIGTILKCPSMQDLFDFPNPLY